MSEGTLYTIGQAVALLQPEFPDLTPSSLRFLEQEGLLYPQRTRGGHRLYSEQDLARVRLIKRLQAQRYYPLEVIRHLLAKLEQARDVEAEMAFLESLYAPLTYDPSFVPLTREQLAARTGLAVADLARLEDMGLLFPQQPHRNGNHGRGGHGNHVNGNGSGKAPRYDEDDLKVAELVAQELRLGATLDDFAPYAAAMRALVREEFNLFYRLAGTGEPAPERVRQLKEAADLVHALLRAKLTRHLMAQARRDPTLGEGN